MRRQITLLVPCFILAAAQAQSVPPAARTSDRWNPSAPTTASSAHAPHFKFKQPHGYTRPPSNAAQEQSGKASVMNTGAIDRNGRPTVDCPQTPMDPACH